MSFPRGRANEQDGAAAVEFAIIAPVLFMLIFGIIQFGIAWSQKEVFVQAAREGARYAAVGCDKATGCAGITDVQNRVRDAAVGYAITGGPSAVSVTPSPGCAQGDTGQLVTVQWTQNFVITIPFVPNVNVNAPIKAVFRCET